jgi:hypothetical protein
VRPGSRTRDSCRNRNARAPVQEARSRVARCDKRVVDQDEGGPDDRLELPTAEAQLRRPRIPLEEGLDLCS